MSDRNVKMMTAAPILLAALQETLDSLITMLKHAHGNTPRASYIDIHPAVVSARAAIRSAT